MRKISRVGYDYMTVMVDRYGDRRLRPVYRNISNLLQQHHDHNRELAKTFPTEVSMSTGRYNPLTKQI